MPSVPLIVGVTSHRNLAFAEIDAVRQRVREFLDNLKRGFPDLPLVLLSAMAEGGDRLAAEQALACGAHLIAVLPLPPALYTDDFTDAASRAQFHTLCARAEVLQMPLLPHNTAAGVAVDGLQRDRQYAEAGVFIASHCHVLLALWDGRASSLLGGTGQIVRYHLEGAVPGGIERRRTARALLDFDDESLVYHIVCSRNDNEMPARSPPASLRSLDARWLSRGQVKPAADGMPAEFQLMFTRMTQLNSDMHNHRDDIERDTTLAHPDAEAAIALADTIESLFDATDWLAMHFQKQVLRAMRGIHALAVLMGIAFIYYADLSSRDLMIYVFLLLFASGLLLEKLARRRDWHRKYIDYRALAEGLRVQRHWRNAGIAATSSMAFAHDNFLQKQDIELGWIRNVMRAAGLRAVDTDQVSPVTLTAVIDEWIGAPGHGGQLDYYDRKTDERSHLARGTRNIGRICLWGGVAISVSLALLRQQIDVHTTSVLVAAMGVLAIIATARESYAYRKADKELIKQYQFMRKIFANARNALDATDDLDERRAVLRALGEAALAEHAEWTLMHRERPLEHGRM